PTTEHSGGNELFDDERDEDNDGVPNALSFGGIASPYLTWAHYGRTQPRSLLWRFPPQFPMVELPERGPNGLPAWSIMAQQSQGYFNQHLSPAHSARAMERGFSLLVRVQPVRGLAVAGVDTAPAGPRFDLAIRRLDAARVEVRLMSSIVPVEGI